MARITRTWQDVEISELRRRHAAGETTVEIAAALGRTADSVRGRLCWEAEKGTALPVAKAEAEAIKESGRAAEIERLRAEIERRTHPNRLPVECAAIPPLAIGDLWRRAEEEAIARIQHAHERSKFKVSFDSRPVAVSFISDQHIAPGTPVDFKRMREDAELIAATDGLYAILAGDGVDNHIKIRPAALAARSQPHEQWELFEWYLAIFANKIVCLCSGNHDAWTDQLAGVDMLSRIAQAQKLCYSPAEARIEVAVGKQPYYLAVRHQYRYNSSFNQGHTVKQWFRMGDESFDVGCIAHHHEASVEQFIAHGQVRWACRPGSYQVTSAYSRQFGFNFSRATCPTFLLFPGERRIIGFHDVRDAVKTLAAERG